MQAATSASSHFTTNNGQNGQSEEAVPESKNIICRHDVRIFDGEESVGAEYVLPPWGLLQVSSSCARISAQEMEHGIDI